MSALRTSEEQRTGKVPGVSEHAPEEPSRRRGRSAITAVLRPSVERIAGWLAGGQRGLRALSALRLLYGVAMVAHLLTSARDRHYLWGVGSTWVEAEAAVRGWPEWLRQLFSKQDAVAFDIAYGATLVLAFLFLVGFRTRVVTPVLLVLWVGMATNSIVLTNGGDVLIRITLTFLLFANLSEHWSVDRWLRRRRAKELGRPPWPPGRLAVVAHNTALVLCCYQVLFVYVNSGYYKLIGEEWQEGTAIYYALNLDIFMPFPGLSELAWQFALPVLLLSWMTIWIQLLAPVAMLWTPARHGVLAALAGMHFGIGLFLGLWPFSLVMIGMDLLFTKETEWQRAGAWLVARGRQARVRLARTPTARTRSGRPRR